MKYTFNGSSWTLAETIMQEGDHPLSRPKLIHDIADGDSAVSLVWCEIKLEDYDTELEVYARNIKKYYTASAWDTLAVPGISPGVETCFKSKAMNAEGGVSAWGSQSCCTIESAARFIERAIGRGIARGMKW